MNEQQRRKRQSVGLKLLLGVLIVFVTVATLLDIVNHGSGKDNDYDVNMAVENVTGFQAGEGSASSSDLVLDSRERALYEADPSSMGYTESDREFLREHGVSEEEARAMETIAAQHGVE